MKKILLLCVFVFFSACGATKVATKDIQAETGKLSLLETYKKRVNDNGLLEVELIFYADLKTKIAYKIEWLDKDGFTLRNAIDDEYDNIVLPRKERIIIRKIAQDNRATDIKIHIK